MAKRQLGTSELATSMGLINRAVALDPVAWERMVYLYTPLIEYWARKRGVSDIDGICQEVFVSLFRALSNFQKRQNGSFRGWIRTITNNLINKVVGKKDVLLTAAHSIEWLDEAKKAKHSFGTMFDSDEEDGSIEDSILFRRIMDWVQENNSSTQAKMFTQIVIDGRSARDVAADFGTTPNVIYQTKSRILASIRRVFRNLV